MPKASEIKKNNTVVFDGKTCIVRDIERSCRGWAQKLFGYGEFRKYRRVQGFSLARAWPGKISWKGHFSYRSIDPRSKSGNGQCIEK